MRRILPALIAIAVLLCGLHIGEADTAHRAADHRAAQGAVAVVGDDGDADGDRPAKMAEKGGHHHCPVAPDQGVVAAECREMPGAIAVARPVPALASLAQAPPTEPPSA